MTCSVLSAANVFVFSAAMAFVESSENCFGVNAEATEGFSTAACEVVIALTVLSGSAATTAGENAANVLGFTLLICFAVMVDAVAGVTAAACFGVRALADVGNGTAAIRRGADVVVIRAVVVGMETVLVVEAMELAVVDEDEELEEDGAAVVEGA